MTSIPRDVLPSRRAVLAGAAASLATTRASAAVPTFRLGTLPLGTATWEAAVIASRGLDAAAGVRLEVAKLASPEAARVAFVGGAVDAIVSDLLFAARLRAEGRKVRFLPYSTSEGGLMVPPASPVASVGELRGKTIGVAGGPLDKNWILLRAAALQANGLDLRAEASPVFAAPPLLAAKLERGELDAALLYWTFCARLRAKDFREIAGTQTIASALGAPGQVALLGYLVRETVDPAALAGFAQASRAAKQIMATDAQAWAALRPIMEAPDEATFEVLRAAFLDGVPHQTRQAEIANATVLFALLARLGGEPLVGAARELPAGLYVDEAVYG